MLSTYINIHYNGLLLYNCYIISYSDKHLFSKQHVHFTSKHGEITFYL